MSLLFTNHVGHAIDTVAARLKPSGVFVVADVNTANLLLPRVRVESSALTDAKVVTIKAGEMFKNIDTLGAVWKQLGDLGANRRSLVVNFGGGVVTDLGAFAAATFKRGVPFVNVPTTLLGAVDASLGGKTGINFNGLKNEVGAFADADTVVVSTVFFRSLDSTQLLSGYAEMVKHALLDSPEMTAELYKYDITDYRDDTLLELLRQSVAIKQRIVGSDPRETTGQRKALNLGHTAGHAFESLALSRQSPLPHGYAVAFGILVALVLSRMKTGFPSDALTRYTAFVSECYGTFPICCDDYATLLATMHHDKKNVNSTEISTTLLADVGRPLTDQAVTDADMKAALDIYRDLLHLA